MYAVTKPYKVLVIDDDEEDYLLIKDYLSELGEDLYQVDWSSDYNSGSKTMQEKRHHIYLIDHLLGAGTGLDLIAYAASQGCKAPKILLTGMGNLDLDMRAIRAGADDYLPKTQLNTEMLERTIRHALERFEQHLLYESQQVKFKTLFDQSNDAIYILDENLKFTEANKSFLQMFRVEHDALQDRYLRDIFIRMEDYERFYLQKIQDGFVKNFTAELGLEMQENIIAMVSISTLHDAEQQSDGFQGIIHDITQLKKAEKELFRAEKLNITGQMARIIAHEVRNPLTNINLATDKLQDLLREENPDAASYAEIIRRSSDRINNLISDLLNSTRLAKPELIPYPIEEALDDALLFCEDRIQLKGIALTKTGFENSTLFQIDADKLKIAFVNIITNAIEAMENVQEPKLDLSVEVSPSEALLKIADNGKGMDENTQKHLFEAFFTQRTGGMGLGMTAVQNIILQHQGQINVTSAPGKGTTFLIQIPRY